jgi:rhamnosyltransferase subunit B
VVHHGGIGTSAQAMRAGVPQLVMPLADDQADNGTRMRRLGVANLLFPKRFTGEAGADRLRFLMADDGVRRSARAVSERFRSSDSVSAVCTLVEELGD